MNTLAKELAKQLDSFKVLPVVTPASPENTVELAKALSAGGIGAIEITLRNETALEALVAVKESGVDIAVGVGTVTSEELVHKVSDIGVAFAVSPGVTHRVLGASQERELALLPGVSGPSELMLGLEYGLELFKLFPAGAINGEKMLKALYGPFPNIKFCPTGGIGPSNALEYLNMPNVLCIGGSWMVPQNLVEQGDWQAIESLSRDTVSLVNS